MSRDKQIDYKKFARAMRENCCKNSDGNIVCTSELWELIASTIEGVGEYRKASDVAEEIFAEIEALIYSKCFSIRADRDVTGLIIDGEQFAELKKKYTEVAQRPEVLNDQSSGLSDPEGDRLESRPE